MAVTYNRNLGVWQVNGRGGYPTKEAAAAADTSGTPAPTATDSFGQGPTQGGINVAGPTRTPEQIAADQRAAAAQNMTAAAQVTARNNAVRSPTGGASYDPNAQVNAYMRGNIGGVGGAHIAQNPGAQASWQASRVPANTPGGFEAAMSENTGHGVRAPAGGMPAPGSNQNPVGASTNPNSGDLGGAPGFASVDYSRYDQAAQAYARAESTFLSELDRLSGVDPFGNQAFMQKATDRAVAQARGTAAMQRGGAAAQAGALRSAVGVQSQLAARGIEDMTIQRSRDEVAAGQLRGQAAAGLAGVAGERAQNEVELAKLQTDTISNNLNAWIQHQGITLPLEQRDVENLRQIAVEYSQIDMERYKTDVAYQQHVDEMILGKYQADKNFQAVKAKIDADENMSFGEFTQGLIGAGAGILGGVSKITSDRRAKFKVADPDLRDLQDFLGTTRPKTYHYREPSKPGRKTGLQFGFMAQDLAKSKIGRTVVTEGPDGMLQVDPGRLAMADHAALAALAKDVEALKKTAKK